MEQKTVELEVLAHNQGKHRDLINRAINTIKTTTNQEYMEELLNPQLEMEMEESINSEMEMEESINLSYIPPTNEEMPPPPYYSLL